MGPRTTGLGPRLTGLGPRTIGLGPRIEVKRIGFIRNRNRIFKNAIPLGIKRIPDYPLLVSLSKETGI